MSAPAPASEDASGYHRPRAAAPPHAVEKAELQYFDLHVWILRRRARAVEPHLQRRDRDRRARIKKTISSTSTSPRATICIPTGAWCCTRSRRIHAGRRPASPIQSLRAALGVDVHVTFAEGAPVRNLIEAVQGAHLRSKVSSPARSRRHACLSAKSATSAWRWWRSAHQVTNVSVRRACCWDSSIPVGSTTSPMPRLARHPPEQAGGLKCVSGSAIATPTDPEMIPVDGPGESPGDWHAAGRAEPHPPRISSDVTDAG